MELYLMKGTVVSVYDGDTATISVRWLDLSKESRVRFAGINAAEVKSKDPILLEKALAAKAYVESMLPVGKEIIIQALIVDNYGRMLGTIYLNKKDTISLNELIVQNGFADSVSVMKQLLQIKRGTFKF